MAEDEDFYCEQELISPLDPSLSMVVIKESPIFSKEELVVFPPINHENLQVGSSVYGVDSYLDSPSDSESPSSSSRHSGSSSSFSTFPSDSDGQPPLTPSGTEDKSQPLLNGESPPSDFNRKSQLRDLDNRESKVLQYWWELLLVNVKSKLKSLVKWFSTTLRSYYPVLAVAIWWWMRVRARRKLVNGETMNRLRDTIKQRDERIVKLLHQIAQMNEVLVKHHKEIVSRR